MEPEFGISQGNPSRHGVLNALVRYLGRDRVTVLEVGSYEGQSALVWSAAVLQHCSAGGRVLCVDPWDTVYLEKYLGGGAAYVNMAEALRSGEVYRRFCSNVAMADSRASIDHLRGSLRQVHDQLLGMVFDIVYIDGDHSATAVREDIALVQPLVNIGGLLCGDDLEMQGGDCDLNIAREVADTADYVGYHPGVTVAVWEAFGRVWVRNGTWAVQKTAEHAWQPPEL